jgi:hypothetical protein
VEKLRVDSSNNKYSKNSNIPFPSKYLYLLGQVRVIFDGKRNVDLGVPLRLITADCRLLDPSILQFSSMAFEGRINCLLMKWDESCCRVDH